MVQRNQNQNKMNNFDLINIKYDSIITIYDRLQEVIPEEQIGRLLNIIITINVDVFSNPMSLDDLIVEDNCYVHYNDEIVTIATSLDQLYIHAYWLYNKLLNGNKLPEGISVEFNSNINLFYFDKRCGIYDYIKDNPKFTYYSSYNIMYISAAYVDWCNLFEDNDIPIIATLSVVETTTYEKDINPISLINIYNAQNIYETLDDEEIYDECNVTDASLSVFINDILILE